MNLLLLIKSNAQILDINTCKTRQDFFAYTIKTLMPDYINTLIGNVNQKISSAPDHVLYISETGFYHEPLSLLKSLKKSYPISTFSISPKFYTSENIMFGLTKSISPHYLYVPPPIDENIYIPRETENIYILFDKFNSKMESICSTMSELNLPIIICIICQSSITHYDLSLTEIETIYFESYLDFINSLTIIDIYFVTQMVTDIYLLYELSMCNTLIVSLEGTIPKPFIIELSIHEYKTSISWKDIFEKLNILNIRETLISLNYTWSNALSIILSNLYNISAIPSINIPFQVKTLNISNLNKPMVTYLKPKIQDEHVTSKILEIMEIHQPAPPKPKKKFLLQTQILHL